MCGQVRFEVYRLCGDLPLDEIRHILSPEAGSPAGSTRFEKRLSAHQVKEITACFMRAKATDDVTLEELPPHLASDTPWPSIATPYRCCQPRWAH